MNNIFLSVTSGLKKIVSAILKPIFGEEKVLVKDFKVVKSGGKEYTVASFKVPKVGEPVFIWGKYVLNKNEGYQNIMSQLIDLYEKGHLTIDEKKALEWANNLNIDLPKKSYTARSLDKASECAINAWTNAYKQGNLTTKVC